MSGILEEVSEGRSEEEEVDIPDDPGPAILGKTPAVGSIRRSQGLPVLRDEIEDEL